MTDEEVEGSTSSSPIPISTGPDDHNYSFSSFPSPQLSPPASSNTSNENLYLLYDSKFSKSRKASTLPSFSLDKFCAAEDSPSETKSCIMKLLEWLAYRCCSCCTWSLNPPSKLRQQ